jgi:hypothetical protein
MVLVINIYNTRYYDSLSWASGQGSWLQIQRSGFDSRRYQIFWEVVGLKRGPLSFVSTIVELLGRKSSVSGLESREYVRRDPSRCTRSTLYPQKLALTWPSNGGRSVGIVRSRTQVTEFFYPLLPDYGLLFGSLTRVKQIQRKAWPVLFFPSKVLPWEFMAISVTVRIHHIHCQASVQPRRSIKVFLLARRILYSLLKTLCKFPFGNERLCHSKTFILSLRNFTSKGSALNSASCFSEMSSARVYQLTQENFI